MFYASTSPSSSSSSSSSPTSGPFLPICVHVHRHQQRDPFLRTRNRLAVHTRVFNDCECACVLIVCYGFELYTFERFGPATACDRLTSAHAFRTTALSPHYPCAAAAACVSALRICTYCTRSRDISLCSHADCYRPVFTPLSMPICAGHNNHMIFYIRFFGAARSTHTRTCASAFPLAACGPAQHTCACWASSQHRQRHFLWGESDRAWLKRSRSVLCGMCWHM